MRVLLITYHFPPDVAIGGVRPYQFARLLPDCGIEPWILTVQPQFAEKHDDAFLPAGIPPDHILRTGLNRHWSARLAHLPASITGALRRNESSDTAALSAAARSLSQPSAGRPAEPGSQRAPSSLQGRRALLQRGKVQLL